MFHFDAWRVIVVGHAPAPSPTPFFTLIYLVLYWSANKFVLLLCVAGSFLVPVDLCCCAELVTSSSWFNLSYTRLKRDWIKDAEGLDLPILAVNSCMLFLLFHSIFIATGQLRFCRTLTTDSSYLDVVFCLPVLFHITSPCLDLLARVSCGHYI